jgi:hypothetical protein
LKARGGIRHEASCPYSPGLFIFIKPKGDREIADSAFSAISAVKKRRKQTWLSSIPPD